MTRTLEAGAVAAVRADSGGPEPDVAAGLAEEVRGMLAALPAERTLVRGLFSGGTLCYESLVLLADVLGDVHSNTPLRRGARAARPRHARTRVSISARRSTRRAGRTR